METAIIVTVITAITSLVVSLFTFFQFRQSEKRHNQQFNKTLKRSITTKLVDLRIENYPEAFAITEFIVKEKGNNFDPVRIKQVKQDLFHWKAGIIRMIISEESNLYLNSLREALSKNPAEGDKYSEEQVSKIWKKRNLFRRSLRSDIGILHLEDENQIEE